MNRRQFTTTAIGAAIALGVACADPTKLIRSVRLPRDFKWDWHTKGPESIRLESGEVVIGQQVHIEFILDARLSPKETHEWMCDSWLKAPEVKNNRVAFVKTLNERRADGYYSVIVPAHRFVVKWGPTYRERPDEDGHKWVALGTAIKILD